MRQSRGDVWLCGYCYCYVEHQIYTFNFLIHHRVFLCFFSTALMWLESSLQLSLKTNSELADDKWGDLISPASCEKMDSEPSCLPSGCQAALLASKTLPAMRGRWEATGHVSPLRGGAGVLVGFVACDHDACSPDPEQPHPPKQDARIQTHIRTIPGQWPLAQSINTLLAFIGAYNVMKSTCSKVEIQWKSWRPDPHWGSGIT